MRRPFGRFTDDADSTPRNTADEAGTDGDTYSRPPHEQEPATGLLDDIARLDGFFRTMNQDYGSRLLELENLVTDLRQRVSRLERNRIGGEPEKINASTVLHDEYREIASRMEAILDQYVMHFAALAGAGGQSRDPEVGIRVAEAARSICEALFTHSVVDGDGVLDVVRRLAPRDEEQVRLAVTVVEEARHLRWLAQTKGLEHRWSFDADIGGPVDYDSQKILGSCDPDGTVRLVVFPALLVDNNVVFMKQRVYTTGRR